MPDETKKNDEPVELLHPFYLDTDMSMAFAAALDGGVALEREEVEGDQHQSQAVRNLRGNLRLFGVGGIGAGAERTTGESTSTSSRLVRRHTEASIFIALYDELRRTGRLVDRVDMSTIRPGQIVSLDTGPAVAPLRRIVDQILRLLEVAAPLAEQDQTGSRQEPIPATRQQRRQQAREAAKRAMAAGDEDDDEPSLDQVRALFVALQDDLDQSGMVDVVVAPEGSPSVVLTLDKDLASDQAIEMLHTSRFTVIGKVTEVWAGPDDIANLYRRSVMSLLPALTETVGWGMFLLLAGLAGALDVKALRRAALEAVRAAEPGDGEPGSNGSDTDDGTVERQGEILISDAAVNALNPAVQGPAIQVLPLAICA